MKETTESMYVGCLSRENSRRGLELNYFRESSINKICLHQAKFNEISSFFNDNLTNFENGYIFLKYINVGMMKC